MFVNRKLYKGVWTLYPIKVSVSTLYLRGDGAWEFTSQPETQGQLFLSGCYSLVGLPCNMWGWGRWIHNNMNGLRGQKNSWALQTLQQLRHPKNWSCPKEGTWGYWSSQGHSHYKEFEITVVLGFLRFLTMLPTWWPWIRTQPHAVSYTVWLEDSQKCLPEALEVICIIIYPRLSPYSRAVFLIPAIQMSLTYIHPHYTDLAS